MKYKIIIFLINVIHIKSYCQNCRYLFKNNRCFLFIKRRDEIVKIDNSLKYENIESNMYATTREARESNSSCGPNATFYKHY